MDPFQLNTTRERNKSKMNEMITQITPSRKSIKNNGDMGTFELEDAAENDIDVDGHQRLKNIIQMRQAHNSS